MSPLLMRLFTLVGVALAIAGMQMKARAAGPAGEPVQQVRAEAPAASLRSATGERHP